jgi:CCR4-NOT transcriptional regulation complex NOT5 subunit
MSRQLQLDVDVKKSPGFNRVLSAGVALSTDERARADAVAFLTGAMTTLHRHIERAEAAVERTVVVELANTRNGASVERDETIVKLLEMTEEREWMVDRLEKVERRLVNEEVEPKQVMALEGGVRPLMEAADVRSPPSDLAA